MPVSWKMTYLVICQTSVQRCTAPIQINGLLPELKLQPSPAQAWRNLDDSHKTKAEQTSFPELAQALRLERPSVGGEKERPRPPGSHRRSPPIPAAEKTLSWQRA